MLHITFKYIHFVCKNLYINEFIWFQNKFREELNRKTTCCFGAQQRQGRAEFELELQPTPLNPTSWHSQSVNVLASRQAITRNKFYSERTIAVSKQSMATK